MHPDDTEDAIIFFLFIAFLLVSLLNVKLQQHIDTECLTADAEGTRDELGVVLSRRLLASNAERPDTGLRSVPGTVEENGRILEASDRYSRVRGLVYTSAEGVEGM